MERNYRCRKCRLLLFNTSDRLMSTGDRWGNVRDDVPVHVCQIFHPHWYICDDVELMPEWIKLTQEQSAYTHGKLNCPKCNQKVGAFDNVTTILCQCGEHALPKIRIQKTKIDESRNDFNFPRKSTIPSPLVRSTPSHHLPPTDYTSPHMDTEHGHPSFRPDHDLASSISHDQQTDVSYTTITEATPICTCTYTSEEVVTSVSECQSHGVAHRSAEDAPEPPGTHEPVHVQNTFEVLEPIESTEMEEEPQAIELDEDKFVCAVCLDLFYQPHQCEPCNHIFCGPCLKRLNGSSQSGAKCPLCRETILTCHSQPELFGEVKQYFHDEYQARRRVENGQRKKLPPLPGQGRGPFSLLRQRRARDRSSSQFLAVSAGVCFVICMIFLGFAVFATTMGFVMWYLLEVALDVFLDLYLDMGNFISYTLGALALLYIDGQIPEGHASVINASMAKILGSFSRLANRTVEFINDGEVTEKLNSSYNYMDQFASEVSQETTHLFSKFIQATLANHMIIGCIVVFAVYKLARYFWPQRPN